MFTIEQIKSAHARSKTGADFSRYAADLKKLGVAIYKSSISDGHTEYRSSCGFKLQSEGIYPTLEIAEKADKEKLIHYIKKHQQGGSDFMTLCRQAASCGVEGWEVDLEKFSCTYFDKRGATIMVESIPQVSES
jgi:uncharacterized protein YbcV (DUF1398 family)